MLPVANRSLFTFVLLVSCQRPSNKPSPAQEARSTQASPSQRQMTAQRILVLGGALQKAEHDLQEMKQQGFAAAEVRDQQKKIDAVRSTLGHERARMQLLDQKVER